MTSDITKEAFPQPTIERISGEPVVARSSIPAPANSTTRFFDFFALPRELRDKIYEQPVLFEYEHSTAIGELDWITKAKKLRTSLLLVSRQFHNEYAERCAGNQVLCMRDHCMVRGAEAILPLPNRARFWTMEFHFIPENIDLDFEGLKDFLVLWAAPDVALRFIDLKLHFAGILREQIENGYVRHAIYSLQAFRRVASMEIYLVDVLWDFKKPVEPKTLIARWDGGDDMHIHFLTPAVEVHDTGSEWGNQDDNDPDCCDPSKDLHYGYNEDDEEDQSGSETDSEDHGDSEPDGEDDSSDSEDGGEDLESVDGHDDENCTS